MLHRSVLSVFVLYCCLAAVVFSDQPYPLEIPHGLPAIQIPDENQLTVGKVELGKQLFFDPRLSRDNSISCASCHQSSKGWSNGAAVGTGIDGQKGTRSVLSPVNSAYQRTLFWDGRADSLEDQAHRPIESPTEMDIPMAELATKLNEIPGYRAQFQEVFGTDATPETIRQAIASFMRTLIAGNAPLDRFRAGDESALSDAARRGHDVFFFRANCATCHRMPLLMDHDVHNLGIGIDETEPDLGRFNITGNKAHHWGKFRTPTLRDIGRTAPYMHNGQFATLEKVVDFYSDGGFPNPKLDLMINIIPLSDQEKQDLVTFLKEGLTSDDYPEVEPPALPQ